VRRSACNPRPETHFHRKTSPGSSARIDFPGHLPLSHFPHTHKHRTARILEQAVKNYGKGIELSGGSVALAHMQSVQLPKVVGEMHHLLGDRICSLKGTGKGGHTTKLIGIKDFEIFIKKVVCGRTTYSETLVLCK